MPFFFECHAFLFHCFIKNLKFLLNETQIKGSSWLFNGNNIKSKADRQNIFQNYNYCIYFLFQIYVKHQESELCPTEEDKREPSLGGRGNIMCTCEEAHRRYHDLLEPYRQP